VVVVGGATGSEDIRRAALADIIDLTLSSVDKKTKTGERPVRLCNYMDVYNNTFITDQLDFMVATATDREVARCGLARGDVIITKDSEKYDDIGVPALVRHDVANLVCGYHLAILRPRAAQVEGNYLVYALSAPQVQHQFHAYANGVTRFGLRKRDIGLVEVPLPSLPEQRAIAHVLGTLDDKIELNRRMNETLEAMARALFKSWFVDFDPVRAKVEGRDTGLPQDIADLFPERFVDSEMPKIPHGWEAIVLKDCMNLTMGQSPPGSTYNDQGDGLPFFQGRAEFGFRYPEKRRFCSAPTRVANPDDTLVSVRAPVGDINLAWERCCIGRGVAALRHKSGSSSFTYHSAWALRRELEKYEHAGTVFGAINKGQFEALKVTEPDPRIVEAFDTMAANLDARIRSNVRETHTLAALRDTLLPELISGEFRLRDAEWFGPEISFNATRVPG
jgi:type I restriction enzyme S subunit